MLMDKLLMLAEAMVAHNVRRAAGHCIAGEKWMSWEEIWGGEAMSRRQLERLIYGWRWSNDAWRWGQREAGLGVGMVKDFDNDKRNEGCWLGEI